MNKQNKHFKKGVVWILVVVVIMFLLLIASAVGASGMAGDRTGSGSGTTDPGTTSGSDADPPGTTPTPVSGTCPTVKTIDQRVSLWCGRASQSRVIAFWTGKYEYWKSHLLPLSGSTINSETGKAYHFTDSAQAVITSLKSGKPVIAYTKLYRAHHIIVLTCYDDASQTFTANDSEPRGRGGQQSIQVIGGVKLTLSNLTGPYNGGHSSDYPHAEFLVTN